MVLEKCVERSVNSRLLVPASLEALKLWEGLVSYLGSWFVAPCSLQSFNEFEASQEWVDPSYSHMMRKLRAAGHKNVFGCRACVVSTAKTCLGGA